ncbi:RNase H domain-containing protein [Trichonephila clavipes]|uniref:RNase H domain-containing protein n=1 Tax=Trichonephila clavipes TaxID=2585209 RepID=A0A8X6UT70_TRICX|nr:RNase H domain-containing protein [Trichonephila clavipes]
MSTTPTAPEDPSGREASCYTLSLSWHSPPISVVWSFGKGYQFRCRSFLPIFFLSTSLWAEELHLTVRLLRFAQLSHNCSANWKNLQELLSSAIPELLCWLLFLITTLDGLDCHHDLKNLSSLGKTIVLQWVPAHCGIPGDEKDGFLAKKGALVAQKVSRPLSFHLIKNMIKRSIKARAQEDLYNRVSHKSWWNAILNLRKCPRRRAVAEFRLDTGHDCLRNHLYKIKVAPFPISTGLRSPVPQKTRRVGQRCTLNLSRVETSSRWCGS